MWWTDSSISSIDHIDKWSLPHHDNAHVPPFLQKIREEEIGADGVRTDEHCKKNPLIIHFAVINASNGKYTPNNNNDQYYWDICGGHVK